METTTIQIQFPDLYNLRKFVVESFHGNKTVGVFCVFTTFEVDTAFYKVYIKNYQHFSEDNIKVMMYEKKIKFNWVSLY